MAERRTGAGNHLAGVLEPSRPERAAQAVEPEPLTAETGHRGRGGASAPAPASKPSRAAASRVVRRIKGRTLYLGDDLWERLLVQSHRRDATISDYVATLLDRHVPDHRLTRPGPSLVGADPANDQDAA